MPPATTPGIAWTKNRRTAGDSASDNRRGRTSRRSHAAPTGSSRRSSAYIAASPRALPTPPAALHVAGGLDRFLELARMDPVAIVGARNASAYGLDVARSLGRGLASAGVAVISGMALGVDSAAHAGALDTGKPTVAVLPGPADSPYPARRRALHSRILASGAAV